MCGGLPLGPRRALAGLPHHRRRDRLPTRFCVRPSGPPLGRALRDDLPAPPAVSSRRGMHPRRRSERTSGAIRLRRVRDRDASATRVTLGRRRADVTEFLDRFREIDENVRLSMTTEIRGPLTEIENMRTATRRNELSGHFWESRLDRGRCSTDLFWPDLTLPLNLSLLLTPR